MKGTAHRASTAHPAITFIGRLALAALILVVLVEVYFLARGFNLYREAIEEAGLDEMAASIQSSESFTPIDELPDLYLQAVVAVEDHRFYAHPGFDAIAALPAKQKQVIALYYYENLNLREIGEVLELSQQRVSQIRKMALDSLTDAMKKYQQG